MSGYLLVLTLGPVQEFISSARRTRDLWAGSALLSSLSRAAARSVLHSGGNLIFPVQADVNADNAPVANVILAELPNAADETQARSVAVLAEAQAREAWKRIADDVLRDWSGQVDLTRFNLQKDTLLEIYSAWVPVTSSFPDDRRNLMRLLGARKSCRDFAWFQGEHFIPKSSMDGARESVWNGSSIPPHKARQLRLSGNEQLDAVALIKRAGAGLERRPRQFPSIPRLAADPWLRGLAASDPVRLSDLCRHCDVLVSEDLIVKLRPNEFRQFELFPYEGTVAFRTRLHELDNDEGAMSSNARAAIAEIRKFLPARPQSYMAVLQADGDNMGATISRLPDAQANRDFSQALSGFATAARIEVQEHNGCLVYAGGDDVLALLPADTALECAAALRRAFNTALQSWRGPTLSVGVAFGHAMEDLEDLLDYARNAEKHAKNPGYRSDTNCGRPVKETSHYHPPRNALAVHLHPRGGQPVAVRRSWDHHAESHLLELIEIYLDDRFPDGAAYQLREMARHYSAWEDKTNLPAAMRADAIRLLARKTSKRDAAALARIQTLVTEATTGSAAGLELLANELVIARRLAPIYKESGRRPGAPPPFQPEGAAR